MTIDKIKKRLRDAAEVIRRIPKPNGPNGYANCWPDVVRNAVEAYGYEDSRANSPPPTNKEIDAAWEAVEWLNYLDIKGKKMLWAWANSTPIWRLAQWHGMSEGKLRRWRDQCCETIAEKIPLQQWMNRVDSVLQKSG